MAICMGGVCNLAQVGDGGARTGALKTGGQAEADLLAELVAQVLSFGDSLGVVGYGFGSLQLRQDGFVLSRIVAPAMLRL